MAYKMIVLDLDGTLTNNKKEITPRTYEALMEAQKKGIVVVLASGRPTYGIMPLAKQLKLAEYGGYILAYNGGKIMDCKSGDTVFNQELCPDLVPMLYDEAMKAGVQILTYQVTALQQLRLTTNMWSTRLSSIKCLWWNIPTSRIRWNILLINVSSLATLSLCISLS